MIAVKCELYFLQIYALVRASVLAKMACGDRVVTFQGHHSYIVSIAKLCKENGLFTDVTIMCDDGKLVAHRIVLAAVSPFLCAVLEGETAGGGGGQTTIIVPEVRKEIVQQLLDFLYTGVMKVTLSGVICKYVLNLGWIAILRNLSCSLYSIVTITLCIVFCWY